MIYGILFLLYNLCDSLGEFLIDLSIIAEYNTPMPIYRNCKYLINGGHAYLRVAMYIRTCAAYACTRTEKWKKGNYLRHGSVNIAFA